MRTIQGYGGLHCPPALHSWLVNSTRQYFSCQTFPCLSQWPVLQSWWRHWLFHLLSDCNRTMLLSGSHLWAHGFGVSQLTIFSSSSLMAGSCIRSGQQGTIGSIGRWLGLGVYVLYPIQLLSNHCSVGVIIFDPWAFELPIPWVETLSESNALGSGFLIDLKEQNRRR